MSMDKKKCVNGVWRILNIKCQKAFYIKREHYIQKPQLPQTTTTDLTTYHNKWWHTTDNYKRSDKLPQQMVAFT